MEGDDAAATEDVVGEDCMEKGGFEENDAFGTDRFEENDACGTDRFEENGFDMKRPFRSRELRVLFFSCCRISCDGWG